MLDTQRVLVVLRHYGEIWGRTRFQKIVFLLKERFEINFSYHFIPYKYGPYSKNLQFDIDVLHLLGAIQVELRDGTPYMHSLTQRGLELAEQAEQEMDVSEFQSLIAAVDQLRPRPTDSLIAEAKNIVELTIE